MLGDAAAADAIIFTERGCGGDVAGKGAGDRAAFLGDALAAAVERDDGQFDILSSATPLVRGPKTPITAITTTIAAAMKTKTPDAPNRPRI